MLSSVSVLETSLRHEDNNPYVFLLLGLVHFQKQDYKDAAEYFKKTVNLAPEYPAGFFYLGVCYERMGSRKDAKENLKKAIQLNPKDADSLNYLGYMYAEDNEDLDEAIGLLNRALNIEPQNGAYVDSLGWVYYKKRDLEKALTQAISESLSRVQAIAAEKMKVIAGNLNIPGM